MDSSRIHFGVAHIRRFSRRDCCRLESWNSTSAPSIQQARPVHCTTPPGMKRTDASNPYMVSADFGFFCLLNAARQIVVSASRFKSRGQASNMPANRAWLPLALASGRLATAPPRATIPVFRASLALAERSRALTRQRGNILGWLWARSRIAGQKPDSENKFVARLECKTCAKTLI